MSKKTTAKQLEVTRAVDSIAKKAIRLETRKGRQPSVLDNLATRLLAALERAESGEFSESAMSASAPGSSGGEGSGGGPSILVPNERGEYERVPVTSVEAQVPELGGRRDQTDLVKIHARVALTNLVAAAKALDVALGRMRAIDELSDPTAPAHREAICCEMHCEDAATKAGRCKPCYDWKWRYGQQESETAPPVPADVIAQRIEERERTRLRVEDAEQVIDHRAIGTVQRAIEAGAAVTPPA